MNLQFKEKADAFRHDLKEIERCAREYTDQLKAPTDGGKGAFHGEVIAQSVIAMRHVEDAIMRYGKVLQYLNDGPSIYDTKK